MNIEDLTLKQIREISQMVINRPPENDCECPFIGEYVVVRTYSAGVHVGTLERRIGKKVLLKNARRIWSWEGSFTLSAVSKYGITGGKMSCEVPKILIQDIEIIPCSKKAENNLVGFSSHEV